MSTYAEKTERYTKQVRNRIEPPPLWEPQLSQPCRGTAQSTSAHRRSYVDLLWFSPHTLLAASNNQYQSLQLKLREEKSAAKGLVLRKGITKAPFKVKNVIPKWAQWARAPRAGQEGFGARDVGALVHVSKEQSVAGVTEQRAGHLQMRKRDFRKVLLLFLGGNVTCGCWYFKGSLRKWDAMAVSSSCYQRRALRQLSDVALPGALWGGGWEGTQELIWLWNQSYFFWVAHRTTEDVMDYKAQRLCWGNQSRGNISTPTHSIIWDPSSTVTSIPVSREYLH